MKLKQHTRNKRLQFDTKTKKRIAERDVYCLFCNMNYHKERAEQYACSIPDIMHYINKSAGGLGIEENGVLGCRYHHMLLDNGSRGLRQEMLGIMRKHLKSIYPGWDESKLYYDKYNL